MEEHDGRVAAEGGRLVLVVRHVARGQDVLAGAVRRFMYFVIICCVVKIQSAHVVILEAAASAHISKFSCVNIKN